MGSIKHVALGLGFVAAGLRLSTAGLRYYASFERE